MHRTAHVTQVTCDFVDRDNSLGCLCDWIIMSLKMNRTAVYNSHFLATPQTSGCAATDVQLGSIIMKV